MNKQLAIVGASGHGKVIADMAKKLGYTDIVFFDDNEKLAECNFEAEAYFDEQSPEAAIDEVVGVALK